MIRLTSAQTGNPIFVNPEKINFITRSKMFGGEKNETLLTSENGEMFVTEFPEEVARKVLEWKLAWEGGDVETLYQIAGLEEQGHE